MGVKVQSINSYVRQSIISAEVCYCLQCECSATHLVVKCEPTAVQPKITEISCSKYFYSLFLRLYIYIYNTIYMRSSYYKKLL